MNILLKITNEPHDTETLFLDGGRGFLFTWSQPHRAFIFKPKSQADIDDVYADLRSLSIDWVVTPHIEGDAAAALVTPNPADGAVSETEEQLGRVNDMLAAATKRIEALKGELAERDKVIAAAKAEFAKQAALIEALKTAPAPAAKAAVKPKAKAQPTATDDDVPVE